MRTLVLTGKVRVSTAALGWRTPVARKDASLEMRRPQRPFNDMFAESLSSNLTREPMRTWIVRTLPEPWVARRRSLLA